MAGLLMQPLSFVLSCFIYEFIIAFFIPNPEIRQSFSCASVIRLLQAENSPYPYENLPLCHSWESGVRTAEHRHEI